MNYTIAAFLVIVGTEMCNTVGAPPASDEVQPVPAVEAKPAPVDPKSSASDAHHPNGDRGGFWNAKYRSGTGMNLEPSDLLTRAIKGIAPGKALDLGMGQGRNTVFLAEAGWDVTGIDTADEGIAIAQRNAAAKGVSFVGLNQDVHEYDLGANEWDLIALIYMGDRGLLEPIKRGLRPGGRAVIEFFHADSNDYFPHPLEGFETGELERIFAGFDIIENETSDGTADFGLRPARLVRFIAQKR